MNPAECSCPTGIAGAMKRHGTANITQSGSNGLRATMAERELGFSARREAVDGVLRFST